jgi:hypothetical protein
MNCFGQATQRESEIVKDDLLVLQYSLLQFARIEHELLFQAESARWGREAASFGTSFTLDYAIAQAHKLSQDRVLQIQHN